MPCRESSRWGTRDRTRRELLARIDQLSHELEYCSHLLHHHEGQAEGFIDDVEQFMEQDPLARYQ